MSKNQVRDIVNEVRLLNVAQQKVRISLLCEGDSILQAAVEEALRKADLPPMTNVPGGPQPTQGRLERAGHDETIVSVDSRDASTTPIERATHLGGAKRAVDVAPGIPNSVSGFRIIRTIGRGGMGVVCEAEQDKPRRRVALKIVRPDKVSPQARRRFEFEAEVLARLEHPHVARVYQVGTADLGSGPQSFIAMEFVDGRPLSQYTNDSKLSLKAKLELMATVCDAVQYAHQRGVIHRDLKPGNVLVTGNGSPKVLDFGLARLADQETYNETVDGQVLGTPAYMSPEQASGRIIDVDTRTDVYALGVMLYELATGQQPHDLTGRPIQDALRIICDSEPSTPSSIDRQLRGDVETIVMKAMAKDKDRRYGSPGELAADLRRYLGDEPIEARPPTRWYQVKKFARRNKTLVAATVMVIAALSAGIVGTTLAMIRANQATMDLRTEIAASFIRLAELASQRGRWEEAVTYYDKALAGNPPNRVAIELMKIDAMYQTRDESALAAIKAMRDSNDLGEHRGRVDLRYGYFTAMQAGTKADVDAALVHVRNAMEGTLPEIDRAIAEALLSDDPFRSISGLEKVLADRPLDYMALRFLHMLLLSTGQYDRCLTVSEMYLNQYPQDFEIRHLRALTFWLNGQHDDFVRSLEQAKAITKSPRQVKIVEHTGKLPAIYKDWSESTGPMRLLKTTQLAAGWMPLVTDNEGTAGDHARMNAIVDLPCFAHIKTAQAQMLAGVSGAVGRRSVEKLREGRSIVFAEEFLFGAVGSLQLWRSSKGTERSSIQREVNQLVSAMSEAPSIGIQNSMVAADLLRAWSCLPEDTVPSDWFILKDDAVKGRIQSHLRRALARAGTSRDDNSAAPFNSLTLMAVQAEAVYLAVKSGAPELGIALLDCSKKQMMDMAPGSYEIFLARLHIEAGNLEKALAVCDEGLSRLPNQKYLLNLKKWATGRAVHLGQTLKQDEQGAEPDLSDAALALSKSLTPGNAATTGSPTAKTEPEAGPLQEGLWYDLMPHIDVEKHSLMGVWEHSAGGIRCPVNSFAQSPRLELPVELDGDYQIEMRVTRKMGKDAMALILPILGRRTALIIDGFPDGGWLAGLDVVDGREMPNNPTIIKGGKLVNNAEIWILVTVKVTDGQASIHADLDGKPLIRWSGNADSPSLRYMWMTDHPRRPALGAWASMFDFSRLRVRLLRGTAKLIRSDSADVAKPIESATINLLDWIDTSEDIRFGHWDLNQTGLHAVRVKTMVGIPVHPNGDYELTTRYTRRDGIGPLLFCLPLSPKKATMLLVGGKGAKDKLSAVEGPLPAGTATDGDAESTLVVTVRHGEGGRVTITTKLNGKDHLRFDGTVDEAVVPSGFWEFPPRSGAFALVAMTKFDISELSLRMLTGRASAFPGRVLRMTPKAPTAAPSPYKVADVKRLGIGGFGSTWSPDGKSLLAGDADGIRMINPSTGQSDKFWQGGKDPTWSPDGKWVAFVQMEDRENAKREFLYLAPIEKESVPRQVGPGAYPSWSADGKTLYYCGRNDNLVYALDTSNSPANPRPFSRHAKSSNAAVSPDGQSLAAGEGGELVIRDSLTGREKVRWRIEGARGLLPSWSPDGRTVCVGGYDGDTCGLWLCVPASGDSWKILDGPFTLPRWSADGDHLCAERREPGQRFETCVIRIEKTAEPKGN